VASINNSWQCFEQVLNSTGLSSGGKILW